MNVQYLDREGKTRLAYIHTPAGEEGQDLPMVMFLGGYRSDMNGTKANYLEQQCQSRGQAYLRFDYSGHGLSDGKFEDGTIGSWAGDAIDMLDHIAPSSVIVVGSSMGGWMALLLARARPDLIHGLIGIAAAPDFTEEIFHRLNPAQQDILMKEGLVAVENDYSDEPYAYTKIFYEEAKAHLLFDQPQRADHPMRLIQGKEDKDVLWQTAEKIKETYQGADVEIHYIEDGGHSLSRPEDLEIIDQEIQHLSR